MSDLLRQMLLQDVENSLSKAGIDPRQYGPEPLQSTGRTGLELPPMIGPRDAPSSFPAPSDPKPMHQLQDRPVPGMLGQASEHPGRAQRADRNRAEKFGLNPLSQFKENLRPDLGPRDAQQWSIDNGFTAPSAPAVAPRGGAVNARPGSLPSGDLTLPGREEELTDVEARSAPDLSVLRGFTDHTEGDPIDAGWEARNKAKNSALANMDLVGDGSMPSTEKPAELLEDAKTRDLRKQALQERAASKRRAEGMGDIAEGLGNIPWTSGAEIRLGLQPQGGLVAEGSRRELEEIDDYERGDRIGASLEGMGYSGIGSGLKGSDIDSLGPFIRQDRAESAALEEAQIKASSRAPLRMDRADKQFLDSSESAIRNFEGILEMKPGVNTGPIVGRAQGAAEWAGLLGGDEGGFIDFRQRVVEQSNKYIKEMTGAQMSAQEASRLLAAMPKVTDQDEAFERKLRNVLEQVRMKRDTFMRNRQGQGYSVDPSSESELDLQAWPSMMSPEGEILEMRPDKVQEAMSSGWQMAQ